jgi:hypothetical protein
MVAFRGGEPWSVTRTVIWWCPWCSRSSANQLISSPGKTAEGDRSALWARMPAWGWPTASKIIHGKRNQVKSFDPQDHSRTKQSCAVWLLKEFCCQLWWCVPKLPVAGGAKGVGSWLWSHSGLTDETLPQNKTITEVALKNITWKILSISNYPPLMIYMLTPVPEMKPMIWKIHNGCVCCCIEHRKHIACGILSSGFGIQVSTCQSPPANF